MPNMPNYQGFGIPGYEDIVNNLGEGQSLLGTYTSGGQIANFFGLEDEYGKFFNPANIEGIQEGMAQIPELQNFLHSQAQKSFIENREGLLGHIGKTNLAGTGSFKGQEDKINTDYSNKMFSADKQVQDLVQGYQNQLTSEIGNMFNTAQGMLASGAESVGGFGTTGFNANGQGYVNPFSNLTDYYNNMNGGNYGG